MVEQRANEPCPGRGAPAGQEHRGRSCDHAACRWSGTQLLMCSPGSHAPGYEDMDCGPELYRGGQPLSLAAARMGLFVWDVPRQEWVEEQGERHSDLCSNVGRNRTERGWHVPSPTDGDNLRAAAREAQASVAALLAAANGYSGTDPAAAYDAVGDTKQLVSDLAASLEAMVGKIAKSASELEMDDSGRRPGPRGAASEARFRKESAQAAFEAALRDMESIQSEIGVLRPEAPDRNTPGAARRRGSRGEARMTRDPDTLANYLAMATGFENPANWRAVTPHGDSWVCTDHHSGASTYHGDMHEALAAATEGGPGRSDPREVLGWETTVRLEVSTLYKGCPGGVCTAIIDELPDGIEDHRALYAVARALIDRADRLRALDDEETSGHAEPERPQKEGPMPAGEREGLEVEW